MGARRFCDDVARSSAGYSQESVQCVARGSDGHARLLPGQLAIHEVALRVLRNMEDLRSQSRDHAVDLGIDS